MNHTKIDVMLIFINNFANNGGHHIYGASLKSDCYALYGYIQYGEESYNIQDKYFLLEPDYESSLSPVSGDPCRVCLCDEAGKPQCEKTVASIDVYPGHLFTLAAVVAGGDFGITYGTVNARFIDVDSPLSETRASLESSNQHNQLVNTISKCTILNYTVYSNRTSEMLSLATAEQHDDINEILKELDVDIYRVIYRKNNSNEIKFITDELRNSKMYINISLLDCPIGFILSERQSCECHHALKKRQMKCTISNGTGYITRFKNLWIGTHQIDTDIYDDEIIFLLSTNCLKDLCITHETEVDLETDPDSQCAYNHAGRLCGGCKNGYSLAIGSSRCIHCPDNKYLSLLIFFAAAGFMLVNLTVTKGVINGLIFYANIVWAYQNVFLPSVNYKMLIFLKIFIAWLNLDFGIETCFIKGLDRLSKAWLQFVFPLYTAGMFFVGLRYSSKLSKLFGDRSVPILATLLFLTYHKLLRSIIDGLRLANLSTFYNSGEEKSTRIWALDGNLTYGHHPHIYLLVAVIFCFLFLWVPYTLILLSMQWLRKVDHYGPLRILANYKPVYNAYYGPLKDKHHHWFGVLLVIQGLLLVISSLTLSQAQITNLLLLLGVVLVLLCYLNHVKPYKEQSVVLLETSFFLNIAFLTAGNLYFKRNFDKAILMMISSAVVFLEFTAIILWNILLKRIKCEKIKANKIFATEKHNNGCCTIDAILKNTGGNVQRQDLILKSD